MSFYESAIKAQWDYDNTIAFAAEQAHEKGVEKGVEKGRHEVKKNTAIKLKEKGMPTEDIIEITGLSVKQIE